MSFAQFEREVIGERVRDKIAASKKRGIWVGGSVPLGYASVSKKVVIVPDDAEKVRTIFRRYLALGSITALAQDLEHQGIRTRRQVLSNGKSVETSLSGLAPSLSSSKTGFLSARSSTAARSIAESTRQSWTERYSMLSRTSSPLKRWRAETNSEVRPPF